MAPLSHVHTFPPTPLAFTHPPVPSPPAEGHRAELHDTSWFAAAAAAVGQARTHIEELLGGWAVDRDTADDAILIVSELVSNVIQHSDSNTVGLDVHLDPSGRLTTVVGEQRPSATPAVQAEVAVLPPATAERGRGLAILDALAHRWGITRTHRTTATWFTLVPEQTPHGAARPVPDPARPTPSAAPGTVELLQAALRRSQLLLRVTEALAAAATPEQVGRAITRHVRDQLDAVFTGIALVTATGNQMHYLSLDPLPAATAARWEAFDLDRSAPAGAAVVDGRAFFHASTADADVEFPGVAAHMTTACTHAMAHLPLFAGAAAFGTLAVAWREPRELDPDLRALLLIVAGYAAQALRRL